MNINKYDVSIFAKNLNKYMEINDLKQSDIRKLLNVSKSTASNWCSGQKMPRMDKIEELANHFGILKSDLIEDKNEVLTNKKNNHLVITDEMIAEIEKRPLLKELFTTLSKLDDERLELFLTISGLKDNSQD